jgi:hypothetical protein
VKVVQKAAYLTLCIHGSVSCKETIVIPGGRSRCGVIGTCSLAKGKSSSASSTIGTNVHERVRHLSVPRGIRLEISVSVELADDIMNRS